jgi:antitoxin MazE
MRARLVKIGNSRGIRLPKAIIDQAGLADEVELEIRDGALIITSFHRVRTGWAEAARELRERDLDRLLDEPVATRFDEKDWKWR